MSRYWNDTTDSPRVGRIFWTAIALVVGLSILFSLLGFGLGWFNRAVEVVSPENVTEQYAQAIEEWEALKTSAFNACSAQGSSTDENSPTLVESPELAYAATYRRIVVDYNSRMKNIFEANLVGPEGYPREVPELDQGPSTDWCAVSEQLATIK